MPTVALHSHYWAGSGSAPPGPPVSSGVKSYVPWQINIVTGGGFGVLQVVWEWAVHQSQTTWPARR